MSEIALLFNLATIGVGLWAIFKLALIGIYNYHLFRLTRLSTDGRRRRLGGLMRMESAEVSPHHLIDGLKEELSVPYIPTAERNHVLRLLALATACAVFGVTFESSPPAVDVLVAAVFPLLAVGTALAMVAIHAAFIEARLWRQDDEKCEHLYRILSNSDNDRFPESI